MEPQTANSRRRAMVLGSAALIALSSLISISPYGTGFMLSVGAVALPVLAFLMRRLPIVPTALLGGAGVVLVRTASFMAGGDTFPAAVAGAWPEFFFYVAWGVLLWLHTRRVPLQPFRLLAVLPLAAIDFAANMVELPLRIGLAAFTPQHLWQPALAAVCRTAMSALAMWLLERYGLLVMRRQDALRYRRLLLMTSMLDSELFWMQKSSAGIEATMADAYGLYQALAESRECRPHAARAMKIATDIHEVKKEYMLITRGIGDALKNSSYAGGSKSGGYPGNSRWDTGVSADSMSFSEICAILKNSLDADITVDIGRDFATRHHYAVMSVLHNLLANAVEAAGEGRAVIHLAQRQSGTDFIVTVADQSGGIDGEYLEEIFLPGFSSKMDGSTGEVNRGLGLCIVKGMVEEKFGGRVGVATGGGGTTFTLTVPASAWEEAP